MNKVVALLGSVVIATAFWLGDTPKQEKRDANILFLKPLLLRAMSGYGHTLLADKMLLLSTLIGEAGRGHYKNVNKTEFVEASKAITYLDPYFYSPILYSTTFLTSLLKELDASLEIIRIAHLYDKKNFERYFLELVLYTTYAQGELDIKKIEYMVNYLHSLDPSKHRFGKFEVDEWIKLFVDYAKDKNKKVKQKIEDIEWLIKQTKDPLKLERLKEELETLKRPK